MRCVLVLDRLCQRSRTNVSSRQSRRPVSSGVLLGLVELIVIPQLFLCISLKHSCELLREMRVCQGANLELERSLHRDSCALPLVDATSHDSRKMRRWHEGPRWTCMISLKSTSIKRRYHLLQPRTQIPQLSSTHHVPEPFVLSQSDRLLLGTIFI